MKILVIEEDSCSFLNLILIKKDGILLHNSIIPSVIDTDSVKSLTLREANNSLITENSSFCSEVDDELQINCLLFDLLLKELINSSLYRKCFLKKFKNLSKINGMKNDFNLIIRLQYENTQIIDYGWEYRCRHLLQEREHLDAAMSWLSTLGGAFSALGDFDEEFAERASVTSFKQMMIACRLGDLNLMSRCWLYCSLALIQKKKFKKAVRIIRYVYEWAKSQPEGKVDYKILNICHGIWAKLKYEHNLFSLSLRLTNSTSRRL